MTTRVAVVGATGKLGRLITEVVSEHPELTLHAGLDSRSALSEVDGADIVVDVTTPTVSPRVVEHALSAGARVLVGSSGWGAERVAELEARVADSGSAVLIVPNFSLGSVVATTLAALAARHFDSIEVIERHRQSKVDSPSGTAVRTAELMAESRRGRGPVAAPHADQRARGELVAGIPVHSLRMDGVVAQQEVVLGGEGEQLRILHDTVSNDAYRGGVIRALEALPSLRGVHVGLDALLGLDRLRLATSGE
ncbi:4-hydroxy-tetrahydrodipicolinate reductase [Mycetocola reblochoni]|uniref:4-hydroxy-tetrahydrodipicolinate reductase n=2 Tax=Mycetocola reblochoni TaxID=331618 RepID=A0A1R4K8P6_9MICO|nr:4-hydroxy-tetrahydrodipicolinate reductase [Mycetocola reblochoni]RLP68104.1 4-hydroxy-tetrahydrodipicolinate reductase [Mycetocola reblochoni]SJN40801.1 4-hydroxy-tetrahydrodipicolinate reductase [Mycetocola reblochoni REB411]